MRAWERVCVNEGAQASPAQPQVMAAARLAGGRCPQSSGVAGVTWGGWGRRAGRGENAWELGAQRSRWRKQARKLFINKHGEYVPVVVGIPSGCRGWYEESSSLPRARQSACAGTCSSVRGGRTRRRLLSREQPCSGRRNVTTRSFLLLKK